MRKNLDLSELKKKKKSEFGIDLTYSFHAWEEDNGWGPLYCFSMKYDVAKLDFLVQKTETFSSFGSFMVRGFSHEPVRMSFAQLDEYLVANGIRPLVERGEIYKGEFLFYK